VGRYQKSKTNLDFTEARENEWQWHQLDHMHVCVLLTIKVKYYSQGGSTRVSALLCQMLASCIGGPMVKCFSHDPGAIPTLGKPYRICKKKFNYVFTRKEAGLHL